MAGGVPLMMNDPFTASWFQRMQAAQQQATARPTSQQAAPGALPRQLPAYPAQQAVPAPATAAAAPAAPPLVPQQPLPLPTKGSFGMVAPQQQTMQTYLATPAMGTTPAAPAQTTTQKKKTTGNALLDYFQSLNPA